MRLDAGFCRRALEQLAGLYPQGWFVDMRTRPPRSPMPSVAMGDVGEG